VQNSLAGPIARFCFQCEPFLFRASFSFSEAGYHKHLIVILFHKLAALRRGISVAPPGVGALTPSAGKRQTTRKIGTQSHWPKSSDGEDMVAGLPGETTTFPGLWIAQG
jgi:hypothetical protein